MCSTLHCAVQCSVQYSAVCSRVKSTVMHYSVVFIAVLCTMMQYTAFCSRVHSTVLQHSAVFCTVQCTVWHYSAVFNIVHCTLLQYCAVRSTAQRTVRYYNTVHCTALQSKVGLDFFFTIKYGTVFWFTECFIRNTFSLPPCKCLYVSKLYLYPINSKKNVLVYCWPYWTIFDQFGPI